MSAVEQDVEVRLAPTAAALAAFARVTGEAGVSLEGGGAWLGPDGASLVAHFLVDDGSAAARALQAAGYAPVLREVATTRLDQERPGSLAEFLGRLAAAGVPVLAQYSDHGGRLVIVTEASHLAETRRLAG